MRRGFVLIPTILVLVALAACGGDGAPTSPATPSATPPPAVTSGATISGVVHGLVGGSAAGVSALEATTVTATIGGVTITATIDGEGNFVITGLPAGTVTLTFSGTNARLTIQVSKSEKIKIVVTISGGTASLDEEERAVDGKIELEGRISSFPVEATRTGFYVRETLVTVPSTAAVRHGDTPVDLAALKVGDRVHVRGVAGAAANTIAAELVIVQNTNPNVPANLKGAISAVNGATACPALEFTLSGWTVVTSGATTYSKGKSCSNLAAAVKVHVKGTVTAGTVQARSVQFDK